MTVGGLVSMNPLPHGGLVCKVNAELRPSYAPLWNLCHTYLVGPYTHPYHIA